MQRILEGLQIISKYEPYSPLSAAEGGQIWCGVNIHKFSEEDKKEMKNLDWFIDGKTWSFIAYRHIIYGDN